MIRKLILTAIFVACASTGTTARDPSAYASGTILRPGANPVTFSFSQKCVLVFTQEDGFPVVVSIVDYAKHVVWSKVVVTREFRITYSLPPGTYEVEAQPLHKASPYQKGSGFTINIDKSGELTWIHGPDNPTFTLQKKIKIIEPVMGDTIANNKITVKWHFIKDVVTYRVSIHYMQAPHQWSVDGSAFDTTSNVLNLNDGKRDHAFNYIQEGQAYVVMVVGVGRPAQDPEDELAVGYSMFLTPGAEKNFKELSYATLDEDAVIDKKLGFRLVMTPTSWDSPPANSVCVEAMGGDGLALQGGVHLQDLIYSVNGKPTPSLDAFKAVMSGIPYGGDVVLKVKRGSQDLSITLKLHSS